ncbi:MAG: Gfo/Idh/MocA family oxidoreductase [Bryobacterales bacterium]|nr:Gfo/Idh/MocA family oxidoreductase [Bryobacterales bacterium]
MPSANSPVRIGLVGCGLFGESHLQAMRAVREGRVEAVYDVRPERAAERAAAFGIPRVCSSLEEICSLDSLDAIDVVTPEELHVDPVLTAFAHGKHVFVEKPLAASLDDCRTLLDAAASAGKLLMVGHLLRFETKYAMIRDEVARGGLGSIVSMHARRNRYKTLLPEYGRTHPALENCIHDIDLMLWYAGRAVTRVRGYGRKGTGGKHSDTFWGVIEFEDGPLAVVETIWLTPAGSGIPLDDAFTLSGTEGIARLQLHPGALSFWRETGYESPDLAYDPRVANSARGCLRDELAHFCICVAENRPSEVLDPRDAMRAVRVALALIESERLGRDVEIAAWD